MPRTSPLYYIAPSAISITPNANGSERDLAVYVARGAKVKLYDPRIAALGMGTDSTFQEWTLSGRNRRLAGYAGYPFTIYARLTKTGEKTGYLVFARQIKEVLAGPWKEPYILSPNTSPSGRITLKGADGQDYTWPPIPAGQSTNGRTDYWWVKLGTVSAPDENGQRTVDLDTGILGTDQYNSQWHLNPDDLPDKEVRYMLEDRGQWTATPKVVYTGPTGQRTPDGTLDSTVAAALGWTGEEPLAFTNGQQIDEPYHYRSLTRQRWLTQRLSADYDEYTDADLYAKLTGPTKGWEVENTLETSRVWRGGILWECLAENTAQVPRWDCTEWQAIGGDQTIYCEVTSSAGTSFRNGNVDTILTMSVTYAQEEIAPMLAYPAKTVTWKRMTGWDDTLKTFVETPADRSWSPTYNDEGRLSIVLVRSDMGSGWMTDYRRAQFVCIIDEDGPEPMMAARRIL